METLDALQAVASIAKDLTLTTFMLWFITMMMMGKIVRREELDAANKRTEVAEANSVWWRDRYLSATDTAKESIASLRTTVEAGLAALSGRR